MKKIVKRLFGIILTLAMAITVLPSPVLAAEEVDAAKVLSDALEQMKESVSIGFVSEMSSTYVDDATNEKYTYKYQANGVSDSKTSHYLYIGTGSGRRSVYETKKYTYIKFDGLDSEWYIEDVKETPAIDKLIIENCLSKASKVNLKSESKKSYTISCSVKSDRYKSATVVVSKKTGMITSVKFNLKKKQVNYVNSTATYTYTSGTRYYSNITYGENAVALPKELAN